MRWDGLFADLEAQVEALERVERAAEVDQRARVEIGRVRLVDRLRAGAGDQVRVRALGGLTLFGTLARVGAGWLLLDEGAGREALVATSAIQSVAGLGRLAAAPESEGVVESRLGLRHALRGIARDRSAVRLVLLDQSVLDGTIDRVGADFLELAEHGGGEVRRRAEVRDGLVVPIAGLVAVRRDG